MNLPHLRNGRNIMNSNFEIFSLVSGTVFGIVFGGIVVYLILRGRLSHDADAELKIEFEQTKTRLQTELENSAKVVEERNRIIAEDKTKIAEIAQSLSQTQANLEVSNDRLQNVSGENNLFREKISEITNDLTTAGNRLSESLANSRFLAESLDNQKLENNLKEAENIELQKKNASLIDERANLQARNLSMQEKLATLKTEIEDIRQKSHLEFEKIANHLLESKSEKFTAVNKENIANILNPLKSEIESFKTKVEQTYDKESKERFSLQNEVKNLIEQTDKVSNEANNLAIALKGQAKKQGNWGEVILERILEINGLVRGREYDVQHSLKNSEGEQQYLDVILHLPDNRKLIIDSKVTLNAYERYSTADSEEERSKYLKEHLQALTNHIDQLSGKRYDEMDASPDFVMLFVAVEPAYLTAMQHDAGLWSRAYSKRILLISPTNLMAAVKMVSDLWKRDNQSKNALEIALQGERLYDKFVGFLNTMDDIGKHISRTQESYNKAVNQLKQGKGNLIKQADNLKQLGIKSQKTLPATMANYDDQEDLIDSTSTNFDLEV